MHMPLPQWALWSEVIIRFAWAAIAAVMWFVMSRRGHDGAIWALAGVVLGPLAVPVAIISARRAARRPPIVVDEGAGGVVSVLVVVDPEHPESWIPEGELVNALTCGAELVAVVTRETLDHAAREASLRRARAALAAVAAAIPGPAPRQVILEGRPAAAVAHYRRSLDIPVLVTPSNRFGDRLRADLLDRATQPRLDAPQPPRLQISGFPQPDPQHPPMHGTDAHRRIRDGEQPPTEDAEPGVVVMKVIDARTGLEWIDREECLVLLGRDVVGRLAIAVGGGAQIFPVNYNLDGDTIAFRTDPGSKLDASGRARAAFEIDEIDRARRCGWSVVVSGRLEEVTHYETKTIKRLAELAIDPWAGGEKAHYMRLIPERITGRRVAREA